MRKTFAVTMAVMTLACAGQLLAGGFYLQVGNPAANAEARKLGAAVVIKATGCHDPASAKVTATATGVVNGQRRTIPLEVKALRAEGEFAVTQQWPKEGKWVIQVVGTNAEQFTNTLIAAGPGGVDRTRVKFNMKAFETADIDTMLQ
jgi:hypothetical protein